MADGPVPGSIFLSKPYSLQQVDQTLGRIKDNKRSR